jgi:hypothetical protein
MLPRWLAISVIVGLGLGAWSWRANADPFKEPWRPTADRPIMSSPGLETSVPSLAVRGALTAWHTVLTRADGPRSPMYPTASAYLGQAVAKHGMVIGIVMTADRLLHEWDEQRRAPRVVKFGVPRAYDPVEANDFWWAPASE